MTEPLALTLTKKGTWTVHQTTKSMIGSAFEYIVWCKTPSFEQLFEVQHCLGEWPHDHMAYLNALVHPRTKRELGSYIKQETKT